MIFLYSKDLSQSLDYSLKISKNRVKKACFWLKNRQKIGFMLFSKRALLSVFPKPVFSKGQKRTLKKGPNTTVN